MANHIFLLHFSDVDEYGFKRPENFDYNLYEHFLSYYMRTLTKRARRWDDLRESEKYRKSNKLKRFVRKGVPLTLRKSVWMGVSGARLLQQESGFKYDTLKNKYENPTVLETIKIDLPRTFPDNIYFVSEDALQHQLFNVLAMFASQNSEVGYCQGLNYIAGKESNRQKNYHKMLLVIKKKKITGVSINNTGCSRNSPTMLDR